MVVCSIWTPPRLALEAVLVAHDAAYTGGVHPINAGYWQTNRTEARAGAVALQRPVPPSEI